MQEITYLHYNFARIVNNNHDWGVRVGGWGGGGGVESASNVNPQSPWHQLCIFNERFPH